MSAPAPREAVTVKHTATERKTGMTLDELGMFVQEAMRLGIAGAAPIKVRAGFAGQIRSLEVTSVPGNARS